MRFHPVSRDKNHKSIADHLKAQGHKLMDLAGIGNSVPDLLVCRIDLTVILIEIKMATGRGFYLDQLQFLAEWPGYAGFAETEADADNLVNDPETYALGSRERRIILDIVTEWRAKAKTGVGKTKPLIRVKEFEKQFAARIAIH